MPRPDLSRVPAFYHNYINHVQQDDLNQATKEHSAAIMEFLDGLPVEKRDYAYAEGKWTIKEMLQHIIDAERVFTYRTLCFARKDATPLPSFDENDYADNSKAGRRDWDDLVEEFKALRKSTAIMFASFDNEQLETSGTASGKPAYVLALCYVVIGHAAHHMKIIKERYL